MKIPADEISPGVSRRSTVSLFGFNETLENYIAPVASHKSMVVVPSFRPSTSSTLSDPKGSLQSAFHLFNPSGSPTGHAV